MSLKLQDLHDLKIAIESQAFQELIMQPILKEMEEMKHAYACDSLRELARLKGKREGLQIVIDRLKIAQEEYNMARNEDS